MDKKRQSGSSLPFTKIKSNASKQKKMKLADTTENVIISPSVGGVEPMQIDRPATIAGHSGDDNNSDQPHNYYTLGDEDIRRFATSSTQQPPATTTTSAKSIPAAIASGSGLNLPFGTQLPPPPPPSSLQTNNIGGGSSNGNSRYGNVGGSGGGGVEPKIVFVRAPILNESVNTCESAHTIQQNIDLLTQYLKSINYAGSLKQSFVFDQTVNSHETLEYEDCMSTLLQFPIDYENFVKYSDMVYNYYLDLMQNLHAFCTVAINVNYTFNKSKISELLTHFLNLCVWQCVQPIMVVLKEQNSKTYRQPDAAMVARLTDYVTEKQEQLINVYNIKLLNLNAHKYYKFSADNDVNKNGGYNNNRRGGGGDFDVEETRHHQQYSDGFSARGVVQLRLNIIKVVNTLRF
nr:hypothetical protein Caab_090 [Calliteara abietis nucleopolyhedrovirus]